jgi:hypothetical protein
MSDGRFAVLGGQTVIGEDLASCEVLMVGEFWASLLPMHHARSDFTCAVVARCIIVPGAHGTTSSEVFDEVLSRWIRLPCDLPGYNDLTYMGSALL